MNISNSNYKRESLIIDANKHELLRHGTIGCPLFVYSVKKTDLGQNVQLEHWHEEIEIFMVEDGACLFTLDIDGKKSYPLRKGSMMFVPPCALHGALTLEQEPCKFIAVVFHPRFIKSQTNDNAEKLIMDTVQMFKKHPCIIPAGGGGSENLEKLVYKLRSTFTDYQRGSELLMKAYLLEMMYLYRTLVQKQEDDPLYEEQNAIAPSLTFIHQNYSRNISIDAIADANNCSVTYLERLYGKILKTSPINYLITYRLYIAGTLLTTTKLRIGEIATQVGFNDFSYFGKCFKKYYKISPRDYRKKQTVWEEKTIERNRRTSEDQFMGDILNNQLKLLVPDLE